MEPEKAAAEETAANLYSQADAERDFENLLKLASKLQQLVVAREQGKKATAG